MYCDPETGICEIPGSNLSTMDVDTKASGKPVKLLYFTDPICSSCWAIEPQLRKLKLEYGGYFETDYRMSGLLQSWNTYGGSDVGNPADVAKHWEEASTYYQMPIDGDVWLEDPLHSSFPPSIAFKAAQLQGEAKANLFMRRIREMVFLEKKNITKWEHLERAAKETGLDPVQMKTDMEGKAIAMFEEDLQLRQKLGVRGFPTIFFTDEDDNRFLVYGSKPYEKYEKALLKLYPEAKKQTIDNDFKTLFNLYNTFTVKELSVIANQSFDKTETLLNELFLQNYLGKTPSKNGDLWFKKPGNK